MDLLEVRTLFRQNWYICALLILVLMLVPQSVFSQAAQSRLFYGTVYSANTGRALLATVTAASCSYTQSTASGSDGSWQLSYPYGSVGRITFSAPGYEAQTFEITSNSQWFYSGGIVSLRTA